MPCPTDGSAESLAAPPLHCEHITSKKRKDKKQRRESLKQKRSITTNVSLTTLSSMDVTLGYDSNLNYTYTQFPNESRNSGDISSHSPSHNGREDYSNNLLLMYISTIIICTLGIVGNGIVIWLLGFRVQRNPFMTFILNLAIADLGLLISLLLLYLFGHFAYFPFFIMYSASQFLLTAISIDRCVAVFFPLWHHCHRPPRLSTIVCALMWVLSFLLSTITFTRLMIYDPEEANIQQSFQFVVNAALCLPLMTISTVALFIKVCFKPQQHQRGKLLTILLLTLSFFLLCAFPFNVILIFIFFFSHYYLPDEFYASAMLLTCLNSSVNPFIYFLVGRQRKTQHRESLKMILQRAFKEEEGCTEEAPAETQL